MNKDIKSDMIQNKLSLSDPWYQLVMKMLDPVTRDLRERRIIEVGCGLGGFVMNIAKRAGACGISSSGYWMHTEKSAAT
jgi:tRNA G46 methylase TrmB